MLKLRHTSRLSNKYAITAMPQECSLHPSSALTWCSPTPQLAFNYRLICSTDHLRCYAHTTCLGVYSSRLVTMIFVCFGPTFRPFYSRPQWRRRYDADTSVCYTPRRSWSRRRWEAGNPRPLVICVGQMCHQVLERLALDRFSCTCNGEDKTPAPGRISHIPFAYHLYLKSDGRELLGRDATRQMPEKRSAPVYSGCSEHPKAHRSVTQVESYMHLPQGIPGTLPMQEVLPLCSSAALFGVLLAGSAIRARGCWRISGCICLPNCTIGLSCGQCARGSGTPRQCSRRWRPARYGRSLLLWIACSTSLGIACSKSKGDGSIPWSIRHATVSMTRTPLALRWCSWSRVGGPYASQLP